MNSVPAFRAAGHERHAPSQDLSDGYPPVPHPEVPTRVVAVEQGFAAALPLATEAVSRRAETAVRALHAGDYVDCLLELEPSLTPGTELVPSIFHSDLSAAPLRFRPGMYCAEIGTPIVAATVDAALRSAACAEAAAGSVAQGALLAIALCRPPGHHAGRRRYGGYCYFNNAYVAATALATGGQCCAVLDVDYHLGDGSAELAGPSTPYFSLHADPWRNYPYLDATDYPRGENVDLTTLPVAVDGAGYRAHLAETLQRIAARGADRLVVSLGFDTVGSDPIQDADVALTPADYEGVARAIAGLGLPTVIVLEGGYDLSALPLCAEAFARGLVAGGE